MDLKYHHRLIAEKVDLALRTFPIVVIGGARQTGKSTLLKKDALFKARPYFSCDDPEILLSIKSAADSFLTSRPQLTLDEAQRVPEIFLTLKQIIDKKRVRGQFVISGSAQFLLLRNLGDSLAGRAGYIRLMPITVHELRSNKIQPVLYRLFEKAGIMSDLAQSKAVDWDPVWLMRGGYPEPAWDRSIDMRLWFSAYEATYLERDLRDLAANIDPLIYQRFLRIAASRNGSLMNQANIAQAAGLTNVTCGRYIHLLETSGLISRIYPWHTNTGKRWVKSPRLLFADVALAAHLAGNYSALENDKLASYGQHVESFVLQNLVALAEAYIAGTMKIFHCRSASGFEIDAIVECEGKQIAIEIKSAKAINSSDGKNIREFMNFNPACRLGIVAYRGSQVLPLRKNIWAVPIGLLLS